MLTVYQMRYIVWYVVKPRPSFARRDFFVMLLCWAVPLCDDSFLKKKTNTWCKLKSWSRVWNFGRMIREGVGWFSNGYNSYMMGVRHGVIIGN